MTSNIPAPPPSLKALVPFIQRSQELRNASPPMAYWALYHALQQGIPSLSSTTDPEAKKYLLTLMDTTEALKKDLVEKGHKEVQSDEEARLFVRGFAERVFGGADKEDREGRASRSTAKAFLAASNFIQILQDLEEGNKLDDEMASKLKYSKWKAADIAKALREGRKPAAGPPGSELDPITGEPVVTGPLASAGEPNLALPESKEEKKYVEREMKKLMDGANLGRDDGPGTPAPSAPGEDEGVVHALSPVVAAPDSPFAARRMQSRLSYDGSLKSRASSTGGEPSEPSLALGATTPGIGEDQGKSPNFSMPLHPQLGIVTGGGSSATAEPSAAVVPSSGSSTAAPPISAGALSTYETDEGSMWRKDVPTPLEEHAASASGLDAYTTRVLPSTGGLGAPFAAAAAAAQNGATLGIPPPAPIPSPGSRPLPTPGLSPSLGAASSGGRGLPIPPGETAPGSSPIPPPWAASMAAAAAGAPPMALSLSNAGSASGSVGEGAGTGGSASGFLSHPAQVHPHPSTLNPLVAPFAAPSPSAPPPAPLAAPAPSAPPAPAPAPAPVLPSSLPASSMARAQKLGRWAISALDYEDLDTARKHFRSALDILEGREVKEADGAGGKGK